MAKYSLRTKKTDFGLDVIYKNNEVEKVLLTQVLPHYARSYLHPICGLKGSVFTQNSPQHHPWQHGITYAFHGVNGHSFWLDEGDAVGRYQKAEEIRVIAEDENHVAWEVSSFGMSPQGEKLFTETLQWNLSILENQILLKSHYEKKALVNLHIDANKYGGLFIRMPWSKEVDVQLINSQGQEKMEAEQQVADFVDMHFRDTDMNMGVLVMVDKEIMKDQTYWRVDNQYGIGPSEVIKGEINLNKGESLQLGYQLCFYEGGFPCALSNKLLSKKECFA